MNPTDANQFVEGPAHKIRMAKALISKAMKYKESRLMRVEKFLQETMGDSEHSEWLMRAERLLKEAMEEDSEHSEPVARYYLAHLFINEHHPRLR